MNLILKTLFLGAFFILIKIDSQEFYVDTTLNFTSNVNKVYKLNVSNTSQVEETFCAPTNPANEVYTDIAIDVSNNLYYVTTSGSLYRKNSSNATCEFLGDFTNPYGSIKALVSDSGPYLYAVGSPTKLYKYEISTGTFSYMGDLPAGQYIAGDLFFYNRRLFATTLTGILEINMNTPSASCPFINFGVLSNLFSAFSIHYGSYSKVYVIGSSASGSTLYELDMINKVLGPPIRTYNYQINGAAAYYDLTGIESTCIPTLGVNETNTTGIYFNVINPTKNNIICKTNIERDQITSIQLFDNSGRLIKDFSSQNSIEKLDISDLSHGQYLLIVTTKNGEKYTKKIITSL
ncbi:T9SS type A sorting domain-containing protein [Chryseobacterium paridis]|uniref:T9SS type A sorting domain-containing protein n=1 Tax=Chryseobacterium paridis TaxID=2800328 RepID=A0ABS1FSJ6_9FLAO|nr:T9SS type A sorting domain-containing protein [Chryseobacterium paridis]MBK1895402.1 T9SS type A sorting domain-containing protein [Chryseobacterium paridis]